jgi:hypothetical protein
MLVVSIILEAAVAVIAALAARTGRPYLYGLAFTFAECSTISRACCNGQSRLTAVGIVPVATLTALLAVWGLYREGRESSPRTCLEKPRRSRIHESSVSPMIYILAFLAAVIGAGAGFFLAAALGGVLAGALGVSSFEGAAGYLAVFGFGPVGGLVGLILGLALVFRYKAGTADCRPSRAQRDRRRGHFDIGRRRRTGSPGHLGRLP